MNTMLVSLWKVTNFDYNSSGYQISRTTDTPIAQEYVSKKTSVGIKEWWIALYVFNLDISWSSENRKRLCAPHVFFPDIYDKMLGSHDVNK